MKKTFGILLLKLFMKLHNILLEYIVNKKKMSLMVTIEIDFQIPGNFINWLRCNMKDLIRKI